MEFTDLVLENIVQVSFAKYGAFNVCKQKRTTLIFVALTVAVFIIIILGMLIAPWWLVAV